MLLLLQLFCGDTPASICATAHGFDTVFILIAENTFAIFTTFRKCNKILLTCKPLKNLRSHLVTGLLFNPDDCIFLSGVFTLHILYWDWYYMAIRQ